MFALRAFGYGFVVHSTFELARPLSVPHKELTPVELRSSEHELPSLRVENDKSIHVDGTGWFEVLLTVQWDPSNTLGTRFSHTAIPDNHPLHSEAISADVLATLSGGRQLLRGNTWFQPEDVSNIRLEVWQDSGATIEVEHASLEIRPLPPPDGG